MSQDCHSDKRRKHPAASRPTFLNVADAIGAPNPCKSDLFLLLQTLIRNEAGAAIPVPRHTYFVSPQWQNATEPLPKQFKTDIQDAIDAILVEQGDTPLVGDPYLIHIFPGHYARAGGYTLLSNVNLRGDQIGSVFIDSPVVWTPGSGTNAGAINRNELVRFQDIIFTSDFTETINPVKPLSVGDVLVQTDLRMDKVAVNSQTATWTFNLRTDQFPVTVDNITFFEMLWSGDRINSTASFTVNNGGVLNVYESFFFLADVGTQSFNLNGTAASPISFFFNDSELFVNGKFVNTNAVLTGGVIAGPWTSTGSSLFEITNCSADRSWTFDIAAPGHIDIWSTPHTSLDGFDQIRGTGTAHRDYMVGEVVLQNGTIAITFTPAMQDADYVAFTTIVGPALVLTGISNKTAAGFTVDSALLDNGSTVEVLVMRTRTNLAIAHPIGANQRPIV